MKLHGGVVCKNLSMLTELEIKMAAFGTLPMTILAQNYIGLASDTSRRDQNACHSVATYKSGSKQTWRRIFSIWNHIEKAQTDRTKLPKPNSYFAAQVQAGFFSFFFHVQTQCFIQSSCTTPFRRAVSLYYSPALPL